MVTPYDQAAASAIALANQKHYNVQNPFLQDQFAYDQTAQQAQEALAQQQAQHLFQYQSGQASSQFDLANQLARAGFSRDSTTAQANQNAQQAAASAGLQAALAAGDAALAGQFASRLYELQAGTAQTSYDQRIRDLAAQRAQELEVRQTPYIQSGMANSGFQRVGQERSNTQYGNLQSDTSTALAQALSQAGYSRDYTTSMANQQASNTAASASLRGSQAAQDAALTGSLAGQQFNLAANEANTGFALQASQAKGAYDLWSTQANQSTLSDLQRRALANQFNAKIRQGDYSQYQQTLEAANQQNAVNSTLNAAF